jgi:hypothetical protein
MLIYDLPHNSQVAVHDIYDPLPEFMQAADTLFVDPPYNQSLLANFSQREQVTLSLRNPINFQDFSTVLSARIQEIAPRFLFLEMGKEYLGWWLEWARGQFKYVTFYNSTYYKKRENKCYVIHATNDARRRRYKELEDMDEADIIAWLCAHHEYDCIGDLCMGRGLVGKHAYLNDKRFVGTELNAKRLAVLIDFIVTTEMKSQKNKFSHYDK